MGLHYDSLNQSVRQLMVEELKSDIGRGTLYISPRLTPNGASRYASVAEGTFANGSDDSMAAELIRGGDIKTHEERRKPTGGVTIARVPVTAPQTLAEGEFNRFYMRALCLQVVRTGQGRLVVYRARRVRDPRPESEAMVGTTVDAKQLLEDLRKHPGVDTALRLPNGPNSGLSVKLG